MTRASGGFTNRDGELLAMWVNALFAAYGAPMDASEEERAAWDLPQSFAVDEVSDGTISVVATDYNARQAQSFQISFQDDERALVGAKVNGGCTLEWVWW